MAGSSHNGSNEDFALVRYNSDGSLDTTFDGDGMVTTAVGSADDRGYGVAVQPDGKILVAGMSYGASNQDFALVRYNSNGSLDTTFDGDGKVTTAIGTGADSGQAVALQPDGKILVAGYAMMSTNDFAIVRYNSDGSLDTTFDGDGRVTAGLGTAGDFAYALLVQPDGKILLAGSAATSVPEFGVARFNNDGSLDTSFDGDGKVTTAVRTNGDVGRALALQSDGKILVAGYSYNGSNNDFALVRYNANGSLDSTFDADGKVTTAIGSSNDYSYAMAVQSDGKILLAGFANMGTNDFAMARYNTDGSLDTTFDGDGMLTTAVGSGGASFAMAVQPDGKIVVAGNATMTNSDFAVVRYNSDGTLDGCYPGIDPLLQTFYWYDDTTPLTYMMYQTQPTGTATSATNTTVNFYSDPWPAGWQVDASVMNYLGFYASCNNKTFTVNYYGGTTRIGTQTQTCDTTGIEGQAFFWTSSQYVFAAGERLRVEWIIPRNMTIYWDGSYWQSQISLDGITVP